MSEAQAAEDLKAAMSPSLAKLDIGVLERAIEEAKVWRCGCECKGTSIELALVLRLKEWIVIYSNKQSRNTFKH